MKSKIHYRSWHKKDLFYIILIIGLLKPVGIEKIDPTLNFVLNIDRSFAMIYITLCYLLNWRKGKKSPNAFIMLIAGILILLVMVSWSAGMSGHDAFVYWYGVLCILLWGRTNDERNGDLDWAIKIFRTVLQIYVFADFFFLITLCDLSKTPNSRIYLLGNKNMVVLYIIPYILTQTVYAKINDEKYSLKNIVCIAIAMVTMLVTRSSTGSITCFLFVLISYIPLMTRSVEWISAKMYMFIAVLLFFAIVIFQIQECFSAFIIDVLGKDITLTGRSYIWDRAFNLIAEYPFGYGWNAVVDRIPAFLSFATETSVGHAHNFLLNLAFKGGMQTAILYMIMLFQVAFRLDKQNDNREDLVKSRPLVEFKAFWIVFLMLTLVEAYPTNCIALFFCLYLTYEIKKINKNMGDYHADIDHRK